MQRVAGRFYAGGLLVTKVPTLPVLCIQPLIPHHIDG